MLNTAAAEMACTCEAESNLVWAAPALCSTPFRLKAIVFTAGNDTMLAGYVVPLYCTKYVPGSLIVAVFEPAVCEMAVPTRVPFTSNSSAPPLAATAAGVE